jgi:hypothetical protein
MYSQDKNITEYKGTNMKKYLGLTLLCMVLAGILNAQDSGHFYMGLGIEGNGNSRTGAALGENISLTYGIIKNLEAGISFGFSHNFQDIAVLEPAAAGRWYFLEFAGNSLFAQADLGTSLILEDQEISPLFLGGITLGVRFPFGAWYAEPYARTGYPFLWSAGLKAGCRF